MAKSANRKTRKPKPEPEAPARELKPADVVKAEELGIEFQLWKPGVYSFKCPSPVCHFDSVDINLLLEHISKEHTTPQPKSNLVYVDKFGNEQPGPPGSGGTR
jgi:hypothetical protein